jgi:prophage regulatory protein
VVAADGFSCYESEDSWACQWCLMKIMKSHETMPERIGHLQSQLPGAVEERLLRLPAVLHITGLSRSTLYRLVRSGEFPAPMKVGRRCVLWPQSAVRDWIRALVQTAEGTNRSRLMSGTQR